MATLLKILLGLLIVLPMTAYVVGSLAASSSDRPSRLDPVVLTEAPASSGTPAGRPTSRPDRTPDGDEDDDDDIRVLTPSPSQLDDDERDDPDDRDDDERDEGDDDRDERDERDD